MKRVLVAVAVAAWVVAPSLQAAEKAAPSLETQRLVELCNVWGAIKFVHPYVWTRDVDWDAALVAALPKVRAAKSEDEYAAAVDGMLRALGDPLTRVVAGVAPTSVAKAQKTAPLTEWPAPGVLLVRLTGPPPTAPLDGELAKAKAVIIDLRLADGWSRWQLEMVIDKLVARLAYRELRVPPQRILVHDGYRPQSMPTSGGYNSAMQQRAATTIPATPGARHIRAAFLLNEASRIPDQALALQANGDAVIVTHGASFDELTVAASFPLADAHRVVLRTSELVPVGPIAPHADVELPASAGDDAVLAAALAKLKAAPPKGKPAPPEPPMRWRAEKTYETMKAPDVEHRLLALFRLWTVIDNFYPYKALLDDKWEDVLPAFIPRVIAAEGAHGYAEVMAELATHVSDTHTRLVGCEEELGVGRAQFGIMPRMIERQAMVAAVDDATAKLGVHVGDAIVAVDGEPIDKRMARLRRFVAGSNDVVRDHFTLGVALTGAEGSTAKLTLRDAKGATHEATLTRARRQGRALHWRTGDVVKILDGNVGYVDLDRLERNEVPAMFDKLAGTRAIIFDMRGYPNGTAWAIAPRLNVKNAGAAAAFERPFVSVENDGQVRRKFIQTLPPPGPGEKLYRGKTFMLVDERTISQAEHTGLFFEAAAGTRFVGSQTAGANGDVTDVTLPGGLDLFFTGHDVRHADGRQLQRVGLPIDVRVTPTLAGIRAGRDEVLERALELARK